jgi:hypothetical protein
MDTETTNPAEGEDNAAAILPDAQEVDNRAAADENDDGADRRSAEEERGIEHDGRSISVPKALKPLLLMQADYTRKTQEVAEQRRAVKAERQALHQTSRRSSTPMPALTTLAGQLAQYQQVDWRAWHDSRPVRGRGRDERI